MFMNFEKDNVLRNIKALKLDATKEALNAVSKLAMNILVNAKRRLASNGSIATGALRASGSVHKYDLNVNVGFYEDYALWVEYGRKSGKIPPVEMIAEWVRKKHLASDEEEVNSIAWAISFGIKKNGIKARPFLSPAYEEEKNRTDIQGILDRAMEALNYK